MKINERELYFKNDKYLLLFKFHFNDRTKADLSNNRSNSEIVKLKWLMNFS